MNYQRAKPSVWTGKSIGAIFGLAGGVFSILLGGLLTASTWVVGAELHPWLSRFGTALLVSSIPLLIFGGYCLDWIESGQKSRRLQL